MKKSDLFAKTKKQQQTEKKTNSTKKETKRDDKSKGAKEQTEEETTSLIELIENKACLWDIYNKDFKKRDLKEIAYSEIATALDTTIASVKNKDKQPKNKLDDVVEVAIFLPSLYPTLCFSTPRFFIIRIH